MKVYETDQWTSVELRRQQITEQDLIASSGEVYGGDADSVRAIFGGGKVVLKEVREQDRPSIGWVWFVPDAEGILRLYRANYDSSG